MAYQTIPLGMYNNGVTLADATTYYFGIVPGPPVLSNDTWAEGNYEIAEAGTIEAVSFTFLVRGNLAATPSGDVSFAIRLNDATDLTPLSGTYFDAVLETLTVTGLSQAVVAGDKIALKIVTPTWGTNPTLASASGLVFINTGGGAAPVADFTATPVSGSAPLNVQFTDSSTNTPTSWSWDFGDGETSTQQNPVHRYSRPGSFTVTLTATNATGSDSETKTAYINLAFGGAFPEPWSDQVRAKFEKTHLKKELAQKKAQVKRLEKKIAVAEKKADISGAALENITSMSEKKEVLQREIKNLGFMIEKIDFQLQAFVEQEEDDEDVEMLLLH